MPFSDGAQDDKILRALTNGLNHVRRYGWMRNGVVGSDGSVCIQGAINVGLGDLMLGPESTDDWKHASKEIRDQNKESRTKLGMLLAQAINERGSSSFLVEGFRDIALWNDEYCLGQDEVIQVLERAIELRIEELTTA